MIILSKKILIYLTFLSIEVMKKKLFIMVNKLQLKFIEIGLIILGPQKLY
jgi:hypothetical protein